MTGNLIFTFCLVILCCFWFFFFANETPFFFCFVYCLCCRQPISDDVLILAWKFASVYKNNGGGNDGDALLNSLKKTVSLCLSRKNECKARDYLYFRTFLAESNIWFEKIPNKMSKLVYDEIEESSINNQLRKQQEFIYQHILQEKKENPKNWQAIVNYQETIISRDKINIRQDSIISKYDSNVDLMAKHGTRPEISQNKLYNNFENNFSGTLEYDLNIYLTKLLINAHSINDKVSILHLFSHLLLIILEQLVQFWIIYIVFYINTKPDVYLEIVREFIRS